MEHKTLAAVSIKVEARVEQVRRQYPQHAQDLDARYPGSTFLKELLSYGLNGALCVLVSGPFANLPALGTAFFGGPPRGSANVYAYCASTKKGMPNATQLGFFWYLRNRHVH